MNQQHRFNYFKIMLPYRTEDEADRARALENCVGEFNMAVATQQYRRAIPLLMRISSLLYLKFELPRDTHLQLMRLSFELALAQGLDIDYAKYFGKLFIALAGRKYRPRDGKVPILDWRRPVKELKAGFLPDESRTVHPKNIPRLTSSLIQVCKTASLYFDPEQVPAMFEELLPYFSIVNPEHVHTVITLLNLLFPTAPMKQTAEKQHQCYLPTLFNTWSQVACSQFADENFVDLFSRLARDSLLARHIAFSEYGVFTDQQSALIFTAIFRLLDIPDENSNSAYRQVREHSQRASFLMQAQFDDTENHPAAQNVAQLIIMSLSPACLVHSVSVLLKLENLLQAVEIYFHPSNSGNWTLTLSQLIFHLADMFVLRWNQERSGEMEVPDERKLDNVLKRRFVQCLREAVFMGIFAATPSAMELAISTLRLLAFLDQNLILPGALQRIYPAMQGLVEVHRTIPSIRALSVLFNIMAKAKGYRCHIITLLRLLLPGIDANDLEKTSHALSCIEVVSYIVPFHNLTKENIAGHDGSSGWKAATLSTTMKS